jgi:hypothetical protein
MGRAINSLLLLEAASKFGLSRSDLNRTAREKKEVAGEAVHEENMRLERRLES